MAFDLRAHLTFLDITVQSKLDVLQSSFFCLCWVLVWLCCFMPMF